MLQQIYIQPGVCKSTTAYSAGKIEGYANGRISAGRYVDMQMVRFVSGFPEKIKGWQTQITVSEPIYALYEWRDQQNNVYLAIGTKNHLYAYNGNTLSDVTPRKQMAALSVSGASVTTTIDSADIVLTWSTDYVQVGDWVQLVSTSTVGGIDLSGWFYVAGKTGTTVTITNSAEATADDISTFTGTISTTRIIGANILSSVSGSSIITASGNTPFVNVGDVITLDDVYSFAGLQLTGDYTVISVLDDAITFDCGTAAQATMTYTGTVSLQFNVSISNEPDSSGLYGDGLYSSGDYGRSGNVHGYLGRGWILQAYGQQLLSAPIGGSIYVFDPSVGGRAYPLLNAPASVQAFVVTPERYVIALGINGNYLELAWASQEDYTDWTTSLTNTANSGRTLQGGRSFICGIAARSGTTLLFTDKSVFQAQYVAGTYIYDTPMLADNNGIIGPHAAVSMGDEIFWMGTYDFWYYNGSVQVLPTDDIRTYVYDDLNFDVAWKCHAGINLANKEIWFFYPSANAADCDSYVIYHTDQQCWSCGKLSRSAWIDDNLFNQPFAGDANGVLYQHETGVDANGTSSPWLLETSLMDIDTGNSNANIFGFISDFDRINKDVELNVQTQYYPLGIQNVDGPYIIDGTPNTARVDLRSDGKAFSFSLEGAALGSDFRLGMCRLDFQPSGARR